VRTNWKEVWDSSANAITEIATVPSYIFPNNRKGGTYYGWYVASDGKRKQFSTRTKNKREAERVYRETLLNLSNANSAAKRNQYRLSVFANEYLLTRKGEGISQAQLKELAASLRLFIRAIGDKSLHKVTVQDCQFFISRGWRDEGWTSIYSARKHYGNLRASFESALTWGLIESNPFDKFKKPRAEEETPEYLTQSELRNFVDFLSSESYPEQRFRNIIIVAFYTGLRLNEILNLQHSQIDWAQTRIIVQQTQTFKTKSRKSRAVPLPNEAIIALRNQTLLSHQSRSEKVRESSYIFPNDDGQPLNKNYVSRHFRVRANEVFPTRPGIHFHSLRHSYGSLLAEKRVPLQEIQKAMGHSSVRVTERYARLRDSDFASSLSVLNSLPKIERASYESLETIFSIQCHEAVSEV
jgi:integrase